MNALRGGVLFALLVAGAPLYQLVTTGQLDTTSALVRGGIVAAGCAAGITAIVRLALSWENEAARDRTRKLNSLFSDMEGAMVSGTLKDEEATTENPPAGS
jgi:hypothetical protein